MSEHLRDKIQSEIKIAMKSKAAGRLGTLRLISAAIKQIEVDERISLDDTGILKVLTKMVKQRRDALDQFQKGEREDLAQKEATEIEIIQEFLPESIPEAELLTMVTEAVIQTGASNIKDMGKVMGVIKPKIEGRADLGLVSTLIKQALRG
jgi:uncharacterized protein